MSRKFELTLEYVLARAEGWLTLAEACMWLEAISSCAIENPACGKKRVVDQCIDKAALENKRQALERAVAQRRAKRRAT